MQNNEQVVRECIQELRDRKLALIPPSVAELIRQKNLPFEGDYDDLTALFWKILNDPVWENTYKLIIESDEWHKAFNRIDLLLGEPCTPVVQQGAKAVPAITFCSKNAKAAISPYTAG